MSIFFTMNADMSTFSAAGVTASTGTEVVFTLDVPPGEVVRVLESPRARFLESLGITGYIRSDGRMYDRKAISAAPYDVDDPGDIGVQLFADTTEIQLDPVVYQVTIRHGGWVAIHKTWKFNAPAADTTVDLASFTP